MLGQLIAQKSGRIDCIGLSGAQGAYAVARLYRRLQRPMVVVLSDGEVAEHFAKNLLFFCEPPAPQVIHFPAYNLLPFKFLAYHAQTAAERMRTLYTLIEGPAPPVVITTIDAVMQKIIPKEQLIGFAELLMAGEETDRNRLIAKLNAGGYGHTAIVEEPGDYSVRGGLLDVFSPLYADPMRLEFFGDFVESIRFFSATSQRTSRDVPEAVILPAKEAILKMTDLGGFIGRIRARAAVQNIPVTESRRLVDRIKSEGVFPGIESLISLIYERLDTLFDYVSDRTQFVMVEPMELRAAAEAAEQQALKNYAAACDEGRLAVDPAEMYLDPAQIAERLERARPLVFTMLPLAPPGGEASPDGGGDRLRLDFQVEDNSAVKMALKQLKDQDHLLMPLADWLRRQLAAGFRVLMLCSARSQAERLQALLLPYGLPIEMAEGFSMIPSDVRRTDAPAWICLGQASSGFVWPEESLALITEDEIFGPKSRRRRKKAPAPQTAAIIFEDLKQGDLVVHIEHGIGRYEGLAKLKLNGFTNDFLLILYKDDDKLYLPVDRMSMVQKYMGVDHITPTLDKMGGKSWERVKTQVKRSAEKIAGELLKLYAARSVEKGTVYRTADDHFKDFEAGFTFEETPDQIKAIDEVLADMESITPMDRLICGDVGYGKTEVAMRASFVAVYNGRQVAVLVPTTVLAEQHFATFVQRFERFPINIASLSRFRSAKEQRTIIADLKQGKIDIVIGTHRLLQKDVGFKDLGLLVLDEEQRFGVKHKEKIKGLRQTVDVLTLTATPIPRTLHMSLTGIRDISVISTPPEFRRAIITYLSEYDETVVAEAIRKELHRRGQIFFIHNNIHSIGQMARRLQELVPEVRLDVAHGRMGEAELERVMMAFIRHDIDLLVCTTIVESGLDIPAANTILVNRADRFGLAQMYQLRGRVGRSDEQAYAYLFIPKESLLTRDAQKRLRVLMEHSDLGSGFQIAMSDLQIRGGGTILGASQSGHIAAVGYDMFLKLMETAISELRGEPVTEPLEPEINVGLSTFIPEGYIADIDLRLSAYRRLAKMTHLKEISEFKAEMIDRYGALPDEAVNLFLKIMLRVLCVKAGVKRLDLSAERLFLHFSEAHQAHPFGLVDLITSDADRFQLTPDQVLKVRLDREGALGLMGQSKNILQQIAQHVNF